jgi:hypothetical protein
MRKQQSNSTTRTEKTAARPSGNYSLAELLLALTAFAAAFGVLQSARFEVDQSNDSIVTLAIILGAFTGAALGGGAAWAGGHTRRATLLAIALGMAVGGMGGVIVGMRISMVRVALAAALVCGAAIALRITSRP